MPFEELTILFFRENAQHLVNYLLANKISYQNQGELFNFEQTNSLAELSENMFGKSNPKDLKALVDYIFEGYLQMRGLMDAAPNLASLEKTAISKLEEQLQDLELQLGQLTIDQFTQEESVANSGSRTNTATDFGSEESNFELVNALLENLSADNQEKNDANSDGSFTPINLNSSESSFEVISVQSDNSSEFSILDSANWDLTELEEPEFDLDKSVQLQLDKSVQLLLCHFRTYTTLHSKYEKMIANCGGDQKLYLNILQRITTRIDDSLNNGSCHRQSQLILLLTHMHSLVCNKYSENNLRTLISHYACQNYDNIDLLFDDIQMQYQHVKEVCRKLVSENAFSAQLYAEEEAVHGSHFAYANILIFANPNFAVENVLLDLPNILTNIKYIAACVPEHLLDSINFNFTVQDIIRTKLRAVANFRHSVPSTLEQLKQDINNLTCLQDEYMNDDNLANILTTKYESVPESYKTKVMSNILELILNLKLRREKCYIALLDDTLNSDELHRYIQYIFEFAGDKIIDKGTNADRTAVRRHDCMLVSYAQHKLEQISWINLRGAEFYRLQISNYPKLG